jgi:acetyl-CoA synthetase
MTVLVDQGDFDVHRWYRALQDESVNVWYTAPTAVRRLQAAGDDGAQGYDLSSLRFVASVGEPLDPGAVDWSRRAWGAPIHDGWWQTETGAIMIANTIHSEIRPGSMGHPLPGVTATILARDPADDERPLLVDGHVVEITDPGVAGHLALRPGWPSMFRGYLGEPERYRRCFADGWYLSGDIARRDKHGSYWFVSRADDVIKSAGHLIGPVEVERVLVEHPAVIDAAVIGMPHPVLGELVKAFVTLNTDHQPSDSLARELIGFARTHLGPAVAPRQIAFETSIPHNRSGKVMRRLLKRRELGLDVGDTSTMKVTS